MIERHARRAGFVEEHEHRGRMSGVSIARTASRFPPDAFFALLDTFFIATAYTGLLLLRFDLDVPTTYWERFRLFLPAAVVVHLLMNRVWRTYGPMWEYASVEEARRLLFAGFSSGVAVLFLMTWPPVRVPLSVVLIGPVLATLGMGATRFQSRLFAFRRVSELKPGLRVAIVGAGEGGGAAIREMRREHQLGMTPVVVVDDDPRSWGRSLNGVPIVAGIDEIDRVVHEYEVHQVLLAIPAASPDLAERVASGATRTGVPVKVVPRLADLIHGHASLRDVRDLRIDDLLGREQFEIDLEMVRALLRGRRVLVTGGGGSIGAEIARQVAEFHPAALIILDHDETHLHDAAHLLPSTTQQVLADIRDRELIEHIFVSMRPDVVFHAAALKHVPLLESHACEAVSTNVLGTVNVVDAALRCGVERFVHISTDKAAGPISVMGASKWLAEQVVMLRKPPDRKFCAVRFGNVLGSRGSVIPTFQRQIAAGGPVTVTDPRMTRFFMSTREAVSLVLQAAASDDDGVLMLEMGKPMNILDLAERMIRLCGHEVDEIGIEFTGARPGEALVEEMQGRFEVLQPTALAGVVSVRPVSLSPERLEQVLDQLVESLELHDDATVGAQLHTVTAAATRVARREVSAADGKRA
jgi:FlaA1/EpsC-like NDP-sugar epimerase